MSNLNPTEKTARNKANYLKAKELFNKNKVNECVQYYAPDHLIKSKPSEKGREGIQKFLEGLHRQWPGIQVTVEHTVAENNWVMGRSVATATHAQPVMGVPPTNKEVVAAFWDLHLFNEEGQMVETWNLLDSLAIMQQIGMLK